MMKIKYLDLFAGCGGLTEGFLKSGYFEEIAAVEWQKAQVETLRNRLKNKWGYEDADNKVLHFDIQREEELFKGWKDSQYSISEGLDKLVQEADGIDVIIGGPPCQAYSVAGRVRDENGMEDDYRNFLFEHYLNVVSRYKPKLIVFENVPGMLSATPGGINVVQAIRNGFDEIGYQIISDLKRFAIVNSKDYGVPQNRKRIIIIGIRKDSTLDSYEIDELLVKFYSEILPKFKSKKEISVFDAISDLAKFEPIYDNKSHARKKSYVQIEDSGKSPSNHFPRYHNKRDMDIFHLLAEDIESGREKFTKSEAISKLYEEKVGSKSPIHRYHVLRKNLPSTTIIAHLKKDGNRFIHYDSKQCRTLTPREAARIQTFDDDFEFVASQGSTFEMIGNAVPPRLAEAIARAVNDLINELKL